MRSLSRVVKDKKAIDAVQLYQFFSDFAIEEETGEETDTAEEEAAAAEAAAAEEAARQAEEERRLREEQERASEILAQARREAEEVLEKGREEGYEAGMEQGRADSEALYEQEVETFQKNAADFMDTIRREKDEVMEKYLDDLKRVVLAIAEKVIHTSLKSSENIIHRMIIAATDKLKKTEWAKIYINKCDAKITMNTDVEFLNALSHLSDNVKIVAMDNEEEGICIIELPEEIIDASVSTQLENIKDILNNARV